MKYRVRIELLDGAIIVAIVTKQNLRSINMRKCRAISWSKV